jgi:hypothetical protein
VDEDDGVFRRAGGREGFEVVEFVAVRFDVVALDAGVPELVAEDAVVDGEGMEVKRHSAGEDGQKEGDSCDFKKSLQPRAPKSKA